jgi:hypothetical protein
MQSDVVELLWETNLIIWDEALTQHQHCAKVVDRTLHDIMQCPDSPFGGKMVIFECHNLSLGLATKAKVYKGVGQE